MNNRRTQTFSRESLEGKNHMTDLGTVEWIMLKRILKNYDVKV
jgi:hypothetical protein